jgi:hypothetical protein
MSQDLEVRNENSLASAELAELGREALAAHERVRQCAAEAVENMVRAGQLLCKARDLCATRAFEQFIVNHFRGKRRTAQTYMKLARNWHLLEAAAPPETLTSQRKALRLLDRLLAATESPSEKPARRQRENSRAAAVLTTPAETGAVDVIAASPAALSANSVGDEREMAVKEMYHETLRLLAELSKELVPLTGEHEAVEHALHVIDRTRSRFEQRRKLFYVDESESGPAAHTLRRPR